MAVKHYEWARYHSLYSNGIGNSGGILRYWADRCDLHPRRWIAFARASLHARLAGKRVVVFVHIPKTGGTYVKTCFPENGFVTLGHALLREDLSDDFVPKGLVGTRYRPHPNHCLFATVRDPVTFFRSYYHHVIGHGHYHNRDHYDFKAASKGFDYLMRAIMDRDDAWPSRKFLYPQLFDQSGRLIVSWINRIEMLDADMAAFMETLGYPYVPAERKRSAPVSVLTDYYSDELLQQVESLYGRERDLFGYAQDAGARTGGLLVQDVSASRCTYDYVRDQLSIRID